MDGWMDGWIDGWMNGSVVPSIFLSDSIFSVGLAVFGFLLMYNL